MSARATLAALVLAVAACSGAAPAATQSPAATAVPTVTPTPTTAPATGTPAPSPTLTPTPTTEATAPATPTQAPTAAPTALLSLSSTAFGEGEPIPPEFTCDGPDRPLPIAWSHVPDGTSELALVMHDPDAGGFVHWVVVGIPPDATSLDGALPGAARHGTNDFGRARYNGPCPPSGNHTYVTTLFALSAPLELGPTPDGRAVRQAAQEVAIATARLRGTYRRN